MQKLASRCAMVEATFEVILSVIEKGNLVHLGDFPMGIECDFGLGYLHASQ